MNPACLRRARARVAGGVLLPCLALLSMAAGAQAWLPQKGTYSYSVDFTQTLVKMHIDGVGHESDLGHTDSDVVNFSGSYSPTDRISINASLPYVRTRYRGDNCCGHDTTIDDGTWHSTITDLQLTVNYQLINGAFGLAPYVGAVIPTHDYTTFGHSAPGRGLNEFWLGTYAAVSLNEWIPRTYVQVRGNYAFVEKVAGISHDRVNATLEVGYFFSPSWNARAVYSRQWTNGGINFPLPGGPANPDFPYHDVVGEDEFTNVGGGATWVINERMSVSGFYMETIDGINTHKVDHRVSVGFSYGVGGH
jgi:hypothetical protein